MRRVNPKVYTKKYYLSDCTGYEEFKKTHGEELEPRFKEIIKHFEIKPKSIVLDIGCGRGEMVLYAVKNGATGYGVDYSIEAIKLANLLKSKQSANIKKRMSFKIMDVKNLSFPDSFFDTAIMTDVFEHLYPEELEVVFKELKRVLKRNGVLVIHTAPNKLFNDIGYRYFSYPISVLMVVVWNFFAKKSYPNIGSPKDLRTDSHLVMHINEPTYFSLRNYLTKYKFVGRLFSTNVTAKKEEVSIKDKLFNFFVFLHPVSRNFPLNIVLGSDFVAIVKNLK